MAKQRSSLELRFSSGEPIRAFTSLALRETFSDPLGMLQFEVAPLRERITEHANLLQKGEIVTLKIDGRTQAGMIIQSVRTGIGANGVTFSIDAVSPLKQLFEGSVDLSVSKTLQADAPVVDLVTEVAQPFFGSSLTFADDDIATIQAKTGRNPGGAAIKVDALKYGEAQAQPNETAYAFLARILTRLGIVLRSGVGGELILTRPHYDGATLYTVAQGEAGKVPQSSDRFFGDININDTNEGQYSFCEILGQTSDEPGAKRANTPKNRTLSSDLNSARPPYRSNAALAYKPTFRRDPSCRDIAHAKNVSKLVLGLKAEKAFVITGSVEGFNSAAGTPWTVDTMGKVHLGILGFDEKMWLASRTFRQAATGGQWTELEWIPPGYFTVGDV